MSRGQPNIAIAHWPGLELFGDADLDRLRALGTLLNAEPIGAWDDQANALLADAEVIVGHWGCPPLDEAMLDRTPRLGLFAYAAGTVKMTLTDAVWDRSIRVTSGANANAEPVAEFTLAAILFANKGVLWRRGPADFSALSDMGDHQWGNYGRTVGIVGASLIGRRVIELLRAFPHLKVTLYDPFVTSEEAASLGVEKLDLDELCAGADVLTIHAPALPETMHLIGSTQLSALPDGATVINTARGPLIDHEALLPHLASGRLYAILDVTDPEPLSEDSPLLEMPNVWISPHLAGSQGTELARMTDNVIEEVRRWSAGEPALNEVTRDRLATMA
ncbi:MAG: hydroxyacid dehydrogenase [Acidimicrobiia bacterium]|nr:hydroxyacid dehydrogenase [Acidimicrobiia bacterium]MCY4433952.1 hydroxyacid dehydrogenase [bacterium]